MQWDYVEELTITSVSPDDITYQRVDFAYGHINGTLAWQGKSLHWIMPPGALYTFTVEHDGYVARDQNGNVVNPGSPSPTLTRHSNRTTQFAARNQWLSLDHRALQSSMIRIRTGRLVSSMEAE